jgi:hypothetical protein
MKPAEKRTALALGSAFGVAVVLGYQAHRE